MGLLLSRREIAEELQVSASRIQALVRRGLPTEPDGKIDYACRWVLRNVLPASALNNEGGRSRWNARQVLDLLENARERGEPDELFPKAGPPQWGKVHGPQERRAERRRR
jgi:hypothetical protein